MIIDVTRLSVSPFAVEGIVEMKVEQSLNQHASMYLKGIIPKGAGDSVVTDTDDSTEITVSGSGECRISGLPLRGRCIIWRCGPFPSALRLTRRWFRARSRMRA